MKSRSNLAARIDAGLRQFAARLERDTALQDGALTIRIFGEFSAGKTRLLGELLGDLAPPALAPISSREVQTRLQLEVSHGPTARLTVVERACDVVQGREVACLERFPTRAEIDAAGYDPLRHRLRLCVPLPQLVVEYDGYHDAGVPRRLFVIDMPGWNSGEDAEAPDIVLSDDPCLALVYVTSASRLDSGGNLVRLRAFLKTVRRDAAFLDGNRLAVVITHCDAADAARLRERARAMVERAWSEEGGDVSWLGLTVLAAEFNAMAPGQLVEFRERFWEAVLARRPEPATPAHPWSAAIARWDGEDDIRPRLALTGQMLEALRKLATRARQDGRFLRSMNMHRLAGASDEQMRLELHRAWRRQTGLDDLQRAAEALDALRLDAAHPLADWWREVWFDQAQLLFGVARAFVTQAERALDSVDVGTPDLEAHLVQRLAKPHAKLEAALGSSFARLVDVAGGLARLDGGQAVATLLALSTLQGRYEQHLARQLQALRPREAA
ncbi:hypothetical protein [Telluria beijingensis]|uniref:hypothetical protein n=1 Tax=Telluria beijingensis TaxID=3068633 RepID=UPI0027952894|nr:hypothetical protein [Massilia sp. REN29]